MKFHIPLAFLGALILSLLVIAPAFSTTGVIRFYDVEDTDEDQEWARQGGKVYIEVEDEDLDVNAVLSGASAEMHTLDSERTFYLMNRPVADGNEDGFVNAQDISVVSADNTAITIAVDRAAIDGRVDLLAPYTGDVLVSYEGSVRNTITVKVKSQADPTGIEVVLTETRADSGVFRGVVITSANDSDDASAILKVGKNDVITATYSDEDPARSASKTLRVLITAPVPENTGEIRFYNADDTDEDQEWARQGVQIGIEIDDSNLDVIAIMEGASAERHTLNNQRTFYLMNTPVADRNRDGFVNAQDVSVVSADNTAMTIAVDRAAEDGRVDLLVPYTGDVLVRYSYSYKSAVKDKVGIEIKSLADPNGFSITLTETKADSGIFRTEIDTNSQSSNPNSNPPILKVGKADVITVSYMSVNPPTVISKNLNVETTPPVFSNISPTHNSSNMANTKIEFDVTDSDSGIERGNINAIFAIDENSDGVIEAFYERSVARSRTITNGRKIINPILDDLEITIGATVYWWAVAQDRAGNLAILDRQPTFAGRNDPCSPSDFLRTSLAGVDVNQTKHVAGCQPYAVIIGYNGPYIERILTGPWWNPSNSGSDKTEYNPANALNNSILVDFIEEMDASTIRRFDFEVDGQVPLNADVFTGRKDYVFLTVPPLATNATPVVKVTGEIRDIYGNRYQANAGQSAPQPTPAPPPTNSINPVDLLIRIIHESASTGLLTNQIANLLSNLFIEYFIAPATGETVDAARERLSAQ